MLRIKFMGETPLTWIPQDAFDEKSTLVKVMAWCRQATSGIECGPLPMPSLIAWSSQAKHESVYEKDGRRAVAHKDALVWKLLVKNIFKNPGPG